DRGAGVVLPDLVVRHAGDPQGLVRPGVGDRGRLYPAAGTRGDPPGLAQHPEIRGGDHLRLAVVAGEAGLARPGTRRADRRVAPALRPGLPLDVPGALQHRRGEPGALRGFPPAGRTRLRRLLKRGSATGAHTGI